MNNNSRHYQMFPEDEWGKGMDKAKKERIAVCLWVSISEAKKTNVNKTESPKNREE